MVENEGVRILILTAVQFAWSRSVCLPKDNYVILQYSPDASADELETIQKIW